MSELSDSPSASSPAGASFAGPAPLPPRRCSPPPDLSLLHKRSRRRRLLRQAGCADDHQCRRHLHHAHRGLHASRGPGRRSEGGAPSRAPARSADPGRGIHCEAPPMRRRGGHFRRRRSHHSGHCRLPANANNIDPMAMPQAIDGMKNQVIVQQAHRYGYDHAMFLCGARVTEVVTLDDYKRACAAGNAVMTNFFNAAEEEDGEPAPRRSAAKSGFASPTSTIFPATSTLRPTCLRFRICGSTPAWALTWLLLRRQGNARSAERRPAAWAKNISPISPSRTTIPNEGVGRGMKVAKEQIVGMVAAVDWVLSHTEESMQGDYQKRADLIAAAVKGIPSVNNGERWSQESPTTFPTC